MTFIQNPAESSYGSYNRIALFEGASVRYNSAPIMKRILAYSVDLGIVTALLYVVIMFFYFMIMLGVFGSLAMFDRVSDVVVFVVIALFTLIVLAIFDGYFIYYEYKKGYTPGKKLFGLRVVPTEKPRLTLSQCVFRDLFRLIDCFLILPGLISIAITKKHQRLGDLVAGTWVIYSRRKEAEGSFVYVTPEQYHLYHEALQPTEVPTNELQSFLSFAHGEFITKRGKTWTQDEYVQWETFVLHYVPLAKQHGLDRNSLFLYFAEYCLQTLNRSDKSKPSEVRR